ncbi:MAG: hypothetical protein K0Q55_2356 [Verrucomicrobia bacterium]|jgi:LysM repeat protein|nr:hypothetical protein [Verrucomicrobiota bacterium]
MDYQSLQPVARRLIVLAASSLRLLIALVSLLLVFTASARTYTVKSGDTLQRIAQRELGSAKRWPEIARANNLPPPHTIRLGQRLEIPDGAVNQPIPLAPLPSIPLTTNSSAHPSPFVPPGNSISTNPPTVTSAPLTDDLPSLSDFTHLIWAIPLSVLVFLLFQALNLRISCWFSLVETTYLRCLKLAVYLLLLAIASGFVMLMIFLIGAAARSSGKFEPWSFEALLMIAPFSLPVWFVLSLVVIKRTLECKWRSVVTLLIMSMFVTWLLGGIIMLSTMSIGPIIELLAKLPKP